MNPLTGSSPRTLGSRSRLIAVAITALIHALLVTLLLLGGRMPYDAERPARVERLQIEWLPRSVPSAEVVHPGAVPQRPRVQRNDPVSVPRSNRPRLDSVLQEPDPGALKPLDLVVRGDSAAGLDFKAPFVGRPIANPLARAPTLDLDFQDRSFGGKLGGMARASMCSELKRAAADAVRTGGGSQLAVIAESMRTHRCK